VRVTTAFNKMLGLPGVTVAGIEFTPAGIVVAFGGERGSSTARRAVTTPATCDRTVRRWRHLDLGASWPLSTSAAVGSPSSYPRGGEENHVLGIGKKSHRVVAPSCVVELLQWVQIN